MKKAEDEASVIVRLNEFMNIQTDTKLCSTRPIKAAYLCNLLEEVEEDLLVEGNSVKLKFKPYEIQTVKIIFA